MATYTFYPCKADGVSTSFIAFDLDSDEEARERAQLVLDDHASCAYVEAWQGERKALTLGRLPEPYATHSDGRRLGA
ncbi:hypothetical protein [Phenylobacterium sp.]|jgi:hypothetical protein|uniref:hypothetical protein n=1 Tax=Phenylobacterium sp. TaxID=1871053 RepID=UPI002F40A5DB